MKPTILLDSKLPYKNVVDLAYRHIKSKSVNSNNPAVVNLHGLFGSGRMFGAIAKRLANDLNTDVYNVDIRNHGNSPIAKPYDYLTLTNDVIHLLRNQIGHERPISIIGFSMGGKIGLLSSLSRRLNVVKCISIDMPPYETLKLGKDITENYDTIVKLCRREIKVQKGHKGWKDQIIKTFQNLPVNKRPGAALYFSEGFLEVKDNMKPFDSSADADPYVNYKVPLLEMPDLLDNIKTGLNVNDLDPLAFKKKAAARVLFMRGLSSPLISDNYDMLCTHFPNCRVQEFDTGHAIMIESPTEFYQSCVKHLAND
ncbi:LANO_0H02344g1_1 [Lachancea nothofagi CBS 11611]|uniref:LANO_0H02344g1_1 n=1 Tax=Lachancea nothofagi CBS 11611 TaxID=1266666 RepID=A0A1G4KKV6_9SACH|nr:LANO_0H02344g1_1 [Lachancea nothofagi CBS 11611]